MQTKGSLLLCLMPLIFSAGAGAETIVGLRESDGHLISFDSANPAVLTRDVALSGFPSGVQPSGIDFSPAANKLYIVGRGPTASQCQLYSLGRDSSVVTPVGSNRFSCSGVTEDIDINPLNGNVRLMGGNKVLDVNIDGAVIQLPDETARRRADSAYPEEGDVSSGQTPDIRAVAYDNNVAPAPAGASLFAVDTQQHTLVGVGPDRDPIEAPTALATIGSGLGADGGPLDISGASGVAYMFNYDYGPAVTQHGNLYTVNLATGVATLVGKVGTSSLNLQGMTVLPPVDTGPTGGGGVFSSFILVLLAGLRRLWRGLQHSSGALAMPTGEPKSYPSVV